VSPRVRYREWNSSSITIQIAQNVGSRCVISVTSSENWQSATLDEKIQSAVVKWRIGKRPGNWQLSYFLRLRTSILFK
jgi:hypothetical protein